MEPSIIIFLLISLCGISNAANKNCIPGERFFEEVAFAWHECSLCDDPQGLNQFKRECRECCTTSTTTGPSTGSFPLTVTATPSPTFTTGSPSGYQSHSTNVHHSSTRHPLPLTDTGTTEKLKNYYYTTTKMYTDSELKGSMKQITVITIAAVISCGLVIVAGGAVLAKVILRRNKRRRQDMKQEAEAGADKHEPNRRQECPFQCTESSDSPITVAVARDGMLQCM